jgi:uncharacterized protein
LHKELISRYLPNVILSGGENEGTLEILAGKYAEGKTRIFVCRDKTCAAPVESVEEALEQKIQ